MIVNTILIRLTRRSTDEIGRAASLLRSLEGKIPGILGLMVKTDQRGPEEAPFDLLLAARFASLEDLRAYLAHPAHLEVSARLGDLMAGTASFRHEE
jgi:hypothetical protein